MVLDVATSTVQLALPEISKRMQGEYCMNNVPDPGDFRTECNVATM